MLRTTGPGEFYILPLCEVSVLIILLIGSQQNHALGKQSLKSKGILAAVWSFFLYLFKTLRSVRVWFILIVTNDFYNEPQNLACEIGRKKSSPKWCLYLYKRGKISPPAHSDSALFLFQSFLGSFTVHRCGSRTPWNHIHSKVLTNLGGIRLFG